MEFQRINLHWHDLRHEYASRLVEQHVPLAQVRDLLGHASIVTTERYDNQTLESLQIAAARLERGEAFDSSHARSDARNHATDARLHVQARTHQGRTDPTALGAPGSVRRKLAAARVV